MHGVRGMRVVLRIVLAINALMFFLSSWRRLCVLASAWAESKVN